MIDYIINSEEERLIGKCINRLEIEKLSRYYILRIVFS